MNFSSRKQLKLFGLAKYWHLRLAFDWNYSWHTNASSPLSRKSDPHNGYRLSVYLSTGMLWDSCLLGAGGGDIKESPPIASSIKHWTQCPDGVSSPRLVVGKQLCMYFKCSPVSAERRRTRDLFDIDCPILNE